MKKLRLDTLGIKSNDNLSLCKTNNPLNAMQRSSTISSRTEQPRSAHLLDILKSTRFFEPHEEQQLHDVVGSKGRP